MFQLQRRSLSKALTVLAALGFSHTWAVRLANAQPVPNTAAAGQQLAEKYCVTCHIIGPSGHGGWTDAPRFDAIANRPNVSAAQISAFVQKPHMNMLNDQRPKPEADAIATYILSLRKH
jgi:mono/diheme cytochrome c family protein